MPVQLTESAITKGMKAAALNGRRSDLADAGCPGLRLRVAPSGAASWALCCRDREGRMRRYQLGAWPAVGVSKARDAARALHVEVRQRGADPVKDGREARAKARNVAEGIGTLAALLDHYGSMRGAELRSWPDCKRQISNVFRAHMKRPLASLTRATLQTTADKHRSKQAAAAAIRYIKPIFGWAAERSLLDGGLASIKPPAKVLQRDRVLTDAELAAIWLATDVKGIPLTFASLVKLLILTGQRREEITALEWPELSADRATWTIPRARVKGDRPHVVPLCEAARAILPREPDDAGDGLVFPGQRKTPFSAGPRPRRHLIMPRACQVGAFTTFGGRWRLACSAWGSAWK